MTSLDEVETPVGLIDLERVRSNAAAVTRYLTARGLAWRPHIKTHKSLGVARIQLEAGAAGLTVATPREAEVMSAVTDDLLLAYPPVGEGKLERLMGLPERVRLTVALDSEEVLRGLARAGIAAGRPSDVLVELDAGLHRVGVATTGELVRLAELAAGLEGVRYRGILFYPGQIRMPAGEQDEALERLGALLEGAYGALEAAGLAPMTVSGGSTPTLWKSHLVPGLSEVRAGSCIFNDRESVSLGAARWADLAYTVLATVVSTAVPGQAVVDAGSKALAKETRSGDATFGVLLDRPEVTVSALSEEHGVLDLSTSEWRPRIGERVRVVPNHVCVSVNLQDHVLAWDGSSWEAWPLEARGRAPWAELGVPVS